MDQVQKLPVFQTCFKCGKKSIYVNISQNMEQLQVCGICVLKVNNTCFINIPQVLETLNDDDQISNNSNNVQNKKDKSSNNDIASQLNIQTLAPITNWPYLIDQGYLEYLEKNRKVNKENEYKIKISEFYKNLQMQVNYCIENSSKQQLEYLEKCEKTKNNLIGFYNQKFKRGELIKIFNNHEKFNIEEYKNLLEEIEKTKEKDLDDLYKQIDFYKNIDSLVRFDQAKQIMEIVQHLVSKINFFDRILVDDQDQIDTNSNKENKIGMEIVKNISTAEQQIIDMSNVGQLIVQDLSKYECIVTQLDSNILKLSTQLKENNQNLQIFQNSVHKNNEVVSIEQIMNLQNLIQSIHDSALQFKLDLNQNQKEQRSKNDNPYNEFRQQVVKMIGQFIHLNQEQKDEILNYQTNEVQDMELSKDYFKDILALIKKNKDNNSQTQLLLTEKQNLNNQKAEKEEQIRQLSQSIQQLNQQHQDLKIEASQLREQIQLLSDEKLQIKDNQQQPQQPPDLQQLEQQPAEQQAEQPPAQ